MRYYKRYLFTLAILAVCFSLKGQTFYKTPSGEKYHLASCRMVKNVSEEITAAQAKELGLGPCGICHPENIYAKGNTPSKKAQGQDESVQCKGLTKAGTRCKHMTRIGNGYCFQHQPR